MSISNEDELNNLGREQNDDEGEHQIKANSVIYSTCYSLKTELFHFASTTIKIWSTMLAIEGSLKSTEQALLQMQI